MQLQVVIDRVASRAIIDEKNRKRQSCSRLYKVEHVHVSNEIDQHSTDQRR